ncbi:hypothetical protein ACFL1L_00840 [Thermoplasmatota archaeon]
MDTKNGFLIIGIILIIISAISCIFGYRIRELWPTTNQIYEIGIPYIIGALGVIFFGISQSLRCMGYIIDKRNE